MTKQPLTPWRKPQAVRKTSIHSAGFRRLLIDITHWCIGSSIVISILLLVVLLATGTVP